MASVGTGYDLSSTTFSPDGRIFQVEYAAKAVDNSGIAIGIKCRDGIVLAVRKPIISKLMVPASNRRIWNVDLHVGMASAGFVADSRQIMNRAREEAKNYRSSFGDPIPPHILANRMGSYVHVFTLYSSARPFGAGSIFGCIGKDGPELYMVEPSGIYWRYSGCSLGRGKQLAKTEIEKLNLETLTCVNALREVARITLLAMGDDDRQKETDLEISWICQESNMQHQTVPAALVAEAERIGSASLPPPSSL
eukprot:gnl/Spiro4/29663_TR14553_c0_g1_i1.p1 gnl/Spiro4/29663_TR14553_c0_g1~~gnl/Spiro4/29663_TR14553_c0_g1_i1.p1  ORF type:complete len:265 (+),score=68.58 gnl/Spiro4/29663_TR14553_c0_g1_i1:43-795(+)